ncbi:DUF4283 domain-containing protein [Artemisia annua]|uniref:DUF4283 domain-containing protein n=1 Tax=Artemisia annua TaxID=35608 RepID=A0A2U1Q326_ARTAN|nr:DUF4283 domain-containing protein [Artemisia annua]
MCEKSYGRANFARVLVEIDANKGFVENVDVCYRSLGKSMKLRVEYPWRPPICGICKVFGHGEESCITKNMNKTDNNQKKDVQTNIGNVETKSDGNDGNWKTVEGRRNEKNNQMNASTNAQRNYMGESSYRRGGYTGRGRGNMFGRGNGYQRGNRSNQFVPVKKGSDVMNEVTKKMDPKDKGKGIAMEKEKGDTSKYNNQNGHNVASNNKYAALSVDADMEVNGEEETAKSRFDGICNKGLYVSMEERGWSKEWKDCLSL